MTDSFHSGEGRCDDPRCNNDCHHPSAERIIPAPDFAAAERYADSIKTTDDYSEQRANLARAYLALRAEVASLTALTAARGVSEARERDLREKLASAINYVSAENGSDTPDFILADFLAAQLRAFDEAVHRRSQWYGHHQSISNGKGKGTDAQLAAARGPVTEVMREFVESFLDAYGDEMVGNTIGGENLLRYWLRRHTAALSAQEPDR